VLAAGGAWALGRRSPDAPAHRSDSGGAPPAVMVAGAVGLIVTAVALIVFVAHSFAAT